MASVVLALESHTRVDDGFTLAKVHIVLLLLGWYLPNSYLKLCNIMAIKRHWD